MPILVPQRRGIVRFDVALVHGGGVELPFNYHLGIPKALRHITQRESEVVRNVAVLIGLLPQLRGRHGLVQERRFLFHGIQDMHDWGEHLILHLNQAHGFFSEVGAGGRDRRHGVALVEHLLTCDDVVAQEFDVHRHLTEVRHAILSRWESLRRDHSLHTWQRLSFGGIDRFDPGMGMRAAQHLAV